MRSFLTRCWLQSLVGSFSPRRHARISRPLRGVRLGLEALEQRLTPSSYTVTDASDTAGNAIDVTLRYAISQAVGSQDQNAILYFSNALAGQTLTLSQSDTSAANVYGPTAFVVNNANITVDGSNAPGLVLSGNNALRLFAVTATGSLALENLTVEGGLAWGGAGGGSSFGGGGGGGAGLGGAVYDDGGTFSASAVTFTHNTAQGGAGGSVSSSGSVLICGGGGGLGVSGSSGSAGGAGGGTGGNGGIGYASAGGSGGFGGGGGGGTFPGGGFPGGSGGFGGGGGGGYGGGGFGGGAGGYESFSSTGYGAGGGGGGGLGGGIFANGGTLTLTNDTFTANTAQGGGGGSGAGSFNGPGSGGAGLGGAVFVRNGTLTAVFDTFSGNTAAQGGTDVYVLSDGARAQARAMLVDDILGQTANSVSDFVANTSGGGTTPNLNGSSNDLVRVNGGLVFSSADPMLSPLAGNGGPTQTMALQSGSPAIGTGVAVSGITTDQRGLLRPATPSVGAFDPLAGVATTTTVSNATATFSGSAQNVALTASVTSNGAPVNGGTVNFTLMQGSAFIGTSQPGIVNNGQASVIYTLPAGTAVGTYTIVANYYPASGFFASSDSTHTLTVSTASTTTTISNATTAFSDGTQNVTLTANVSGGAGAVNEGTVTFTVKQGNTVLGSATSGTVSNGQAGVSYVLPAGTAIGSYTIEADYNDAASIFAASSGTASLTVNAVASIPVPVTPTATTAQLAGVHIVPNLLGGTAQVTLTAQVISPVGAVNEGNFTFTFAGRSAQGAVKNGIASVQLTVSLPEVMNNQTVSLTYADNAPNAAFSPANVGMGVALNVCNALLPADVTFTPGGGEIDSVQLFFAPIDFLYANMQWTGFRYGPLELQVGGVGGQVQATLNGAAWQVQMPDPQVHLLVTPRQSSTMSGQATDSTSSA